MNNPTRMTTPCWGNGACGRTNCDCYSKIETIAFKLKIWEWLEEHKDGVSFSAYEELKKILSE